MLNATYKCDLSGEMIEMNATIAMVKQRCSYCPLSFLKGNKMDNMVTDNRGEPQTDLIYCCGAITEVLKFGSCQLHSGHKVLFLIIPGELN